jgi:hypothetical protein
VQNTALDGARDAVHGPFADLAGLALRLELLRDLLQKLGPQPLIDRPGQRHQDAHLVVV